MKVLVADDWFNEIKNLVEKLKEKYEVIIADCGNEAIEVIENESIDAAILDWSMRPGPYGNDVAKIARRKFPEIPIVLRSGIASDFKQELKPFDVYCHDKKKPDQLVLDYLAEKLGGG